MTRSDQRELINQWFEDDDHWTIKQEIKDAAGVTIVPIGMKFDAVIFDFVKGVVFLENKDIAIRCRVTMQFVPEIVVHIK